MKAIDCTTLYMPFLCKALDYYPTRLAQCIVCVEDGRPIAGAVYDGYNGVSISAHVWMDAERKPSREWFACILDYPFNRLQVKKLVGQVAENNLEARKFDEHLGFVEEARIKDYSEDGDLIIYTMTRDMCHILNSPRWESTVAHIRRVA